MLIHSLKKVLARREFFSARRSSKVAQRFQAARRGRGRKFSFCGARRGGGDCVFFFREFLKLERAAAANEWN